MKLSEDELEIKFEGIMNNLIFSDLTKKYFLKQTGDINRAKRDWESYEKQEIENIFTIGGIKIPENILDIGSGIGRISVLIKNYFNLNDTNFYFLDGHGEKKVVGIKSGFGNNFYNSFEATKEFCYSNGISKDKLFLLDAQKDLPLKKELQFDLIYSFKSMGYHWPIDSYLDLLYNNFKKDASLIFELRNLSRDYTNSKFKKNKSVIDFVGKQIESVDTNKYNIIIKSLHSYPALILLRKK